jgi:uncharacterized membrane protein YoaK (UPF0700 family)
LAAALPSALAVIIAAAAFLWPAFYSRFPLIFPDSLEYLDSGQFILHRLLGQPVPANLLFQTRSEIYAATIFLLSGGWFLWSIVLAQALLSAWILWLVVRSFVPRFPVAVYLLFAALLASVGGIAWYVSFVMPDIFGGLLYIALFLVVFVPERLVTWESVSLSVFACWAMTTHGSHLLVAGLLACFLVLLRILRFPGLRTSRVAFAVSLVLLAVVAQMVVHKRLYDRASVFGKPPPFLMARLIGDGPALIYLRAHCDNLAWRICDVRSNLPATEADFLWSPGSVWQTSSLAQQDQLRHEQLPLLFAVLRTHPLQQASRSLANVGRTFITLGPSDFWDEPDILTPSRLNHVLTRAAERYRHSRQAQQQLPQIAFQPIQLVVTMSSLAICLAFLPFLARSQRFLDLGFAVFLLAAYTANAFVCGALSGVYSRYGGRVAWLPVLVACIILSPSLKRLLTFLPRRVLLFETLALAAIAGFFDAYAWRTFGSFVSFISGNTTRGAIAVAFRDWHHALLATTPILGFLLGATAGGYLAIVEKPRGRAIILFAATALLSAFALVHDVHSIPATAAVLVLSVAMGLVNSAVLHFGGDTVSVTFLTGELFRTASHLAHALHGDPPPDPANPRGTHLRRAAFQAAIFGVFVFGAFLSPMADSLGPFTLVPACLLMLLLAAISLRTAN